MASTLAAERPRRAASAVGAGVAASAGGTSDASGVERPSASGRGIAPRPGSCAASAAEDLNPAACAAAGGGGRSLQEVLTGAQPRLQVFVVVIVELHAEARRRARDRPGAVAEPARYFAAKPHELFSMRGGLSSIQTSEKSQGRRLRT